MLRYTQTKMKPKDLDRLDSIYEQIELLIGGIPTLIVDPHNEALPFWQAYRKEIPAVLIHIDNHRDMESATPFEHACKEGLTFEEYAIYCLNIAEFILPAVHYGIVGAIYFIDPREDTVETYGRWNDGSFINSPLTKIEKDKLQWDFNDPLNKHMGWNYGAIEPANMIHELKNCSAPIILDFDLDAIACVQDLEYSTEYEKKTSILQSENLLPRERDRMQVIDDLLPLLPRPNIMTIARSLNPEVYTWPDRAPVIEDEVLSMYARLYGEIISSSTTTS